MSAARTENFSPFVRIIVDNRFLSALKILLTDHQNVRRNLLVYPFLVAGFLTLSLWSAGIEFTVFGDKGAIARAGALGGLLLGFAITALAAAAAFPNGGAIDEPMPGKLMVRIPMRVRDKYFWQKLTRRQFLCHLLAWMCFLCLGAFVVDYISALTAESIRSMLAGTAFVPLAHWLGAFLAFWFIANFGFLLMIAIYYFADRLNQNTLDWTGE